MQYYDNEDYERPQSPFCPPEPDYEPDAEFEWNEETIKHLVENEKRIEQEIKKMVEDNMHNPDAEVLPIWVITAKNLLKSSSLISTVATVRVWFVISSSLTTTVFIAKSRKPFRCLTP